MCVCVWNCLRMLFVFNIFFVAAGNIFQKIKNVLDNCLFYNYYYSNTNNFQLLLWYLINTVAEKLDKFNTRLFSVFQGQFKLNLRLCLKLLFIANAIMAVSKIPKKYQTKVFRLERYIKQWLGAKSYKNACFRINWTMYQIWST